MPTFRIAYRAPGVAVELVEADEVRREGTFVVLIRWQVVILQPRDVVVRRVALADLHRLDRFDPEST